MYLYYFVRASKYSLDAPMSRFLALASPSPKILEILKNIGDWVLSNSRHLFHELFIIRSADVSEFYDNHKPESKKTVRQRKKIDDDVMSVNFNNIIVFLIVAAKQELHSRCNIHH